MAAVAHHDVAGLLAVQVFLDHHACGRRTEGVRAEHVVQRLFGIGQGQRHHHALAGGQAVGLDDDRRAVRTHVGQCGSELGEHRIARGGNVVAVQEILGEGLGAFQLRGHRARAEDAQAGGAETVDHAGHQRHFGADHGEIDFLLARKLEQAFEIVDGDIRVAHAALARGAGVARRHDHRAHPRRLLEFPRQRVLAPAVADDQNLHVHPAHIAAASATRHDASL